MPDGSLVSHWSETGSFDVKPTFIEMRIEGQIHYYSIHFGNQGMIMENPSIVTIVPLSVLFEVRGMCQ